MEDHKRQQALDNFRNALGRLEQSDFEIIYDQGDSGFTVFIKRIVNDPYKTGAFTTISNHTLRLKTAK